VEKIMGHILYFPKHFPFFLKMNKLQMGKCWEKYKIFHDFPSSIELPYRSLALHQYNFTKMFTKNIHGRFYQLLKLLMKIFKNKLTISDADVPPERQVFLCYSHWEKSYENFLFFLKFCHFFSQNGPWFSARLITIFNKHKRRIIFSKFKSVHAILFADDTSLRGT